MTMKYLQAKNLFERLGLTETPLPDINAPLPPPRYSGTEACRRCRGIGVYRWSDNGQQRQGHCLTCLGSGSSWIQCYDPAHFGGMRGGKRGTGDAAPTPAPAPETPQGTIDLGELRRILGLEGGTGIDESRVAEMIAQAIEDAQLPRAIDVTLNGEVRQLPPIHHFQTEILIQELSLGHHVCLVGPAGSGKTSACQMAADALQRKFYLQGAMSGPHDILGYEFNGHYHSTPLREAFQHGGLILFDELDASVPDSFPPLHSGMANKYMVFPDSPEPVPMHPLFLPIGAANTYTRGADRLYVGRYQLDAATSDRWGMLTWDYDEKLENAISPEPDWTKYVQRVRARVSELKIQHIVSPRASIFGGQSLQAGLPRAHVESTWLWKGLPQADIDRVTAGL